MKKIVKLAAVALAVSGLVGAAHAATPGAYLGAGLGYSDLDLPSMTGAKRNSDGLGGRIFTGYNFNKNFGLEAGYTKFADATYKSNVTGVKGLQIDQQSIDLVGKGYLPIPNSDFDLYALAGVSYVNGNLKQKNIPNAQSSDTKKLLLKYGVGANYTFPQTNFVAGMEAAHTQGQGNIRTNDHAIAATNLVTVNLGYNFG